jgi:NAD(P)-dependent dehydrogenase (short-subunit alcohol dehydrogenase family)
VSDVLIVGGSSGLGLALARAYVERGARVGIAGRDQGRCSTVAATVGDSAYGLRIDIADPDSIEAGLRDVGNVDRLVITAVDRDVNSIKDYNVESAMRLATMKLVGTTSVVHHLVGRFAPDASILLYGGLAKDRPYPGSTTVTSVNGAVSTMITTYALELAPVRVNAIHPGIVGDTDYWSGKDAALEAVLKRTPTGRLVQTSDVVDASLFLLENPSVNGVNLSVDGGWMLM